MSSEWPNTGRPNRCASSAAAREVCGVSRSKSLKPSTPFSASMRTVWRASSSVLTMMLVRWRRSAPPPSHSGGGPSMMFPEAHTRGPRIVPFLTPSRCAMIQSAGLFDMFGQVTMP